MKTYYFILATMLFTMLFTACKEDDLNLPPIVNFTMSSTEVETQEVVNFSGSADLLAPATIKSWHWEFGDNESSVSTEQNPTHTYTAAGTFIVKLTVTADNGKEASLTKEISVKRNANELAHASFTILPNKIVLGDKATFTSTSVAAVGATITSYSWNFGDNSPVATTPTAEHTYANIGKYTVTLSISDSKGNSDTYSTDVNILDPSELITLLWESELLPTGMLEDTNSPAMSPDGNTVYAWAGEGTTTASKTQLKAFDVATGDIKWNFNIADAASAIHPNAAISRAYASPSVGNNGDIYIAGRDLQAGGSATRRAFVFAVKADGKSTRWTYPMGQDANFVNLTPAIDASGNIYVAYMTTSPYSIRVIDKNTGSEIKQIPSVAVRSGISLSKSGDMYMLSAAAPMGLYSYNFASEAANWTHNTDYKTVDGGAMAIDADGTVYSIVQGTTYGVVSAVAANGTEKWQFYTAGATSYGGVVIGTDGTLFVNGGKASGTNAAGIHALSPDGKQKWHFPTEEGVERCVPIVDDRGYIHFVTDLGTYYVVTNTGTLYGKKKIGDKTVSSPVMNAAGKVCITVMSGSAVKMICLETGATSYANSPWAMKGQNPQRTHLQK